ncbi:MAG: ABC transporter permease [Bacillaceae bacterium]
MKQKKGLFITFICFVLAFLYIPIMVLVTYSFNESKINATWTGFTLKWYGELLQNPRVIEAAINSLVIAIITTIVATVLGTLFALAMHRYAYRFKSLFDGIVYLPILVPEILMGLSMLILFTQAGMQLGKMTIMIAHITFSISFVVIVVAARLAGMGKDLEEAANDLGATPWQTFRYVTFPSIAPGVVAAALLTFTLSIDDFIISFFVSGPNSTTLPLYIYGLVKKGISPEINALSTILIVVIVGLMVISELLATKGGNKGKSKMPF